MKWLLGVEKRFLKNSLCLATLYSSQCKLVLEERKGGSKQTELEEEKQGNKNGEP